MYHLRIETGCRKGDTIPLPKDATTAIVLGRGYKAGIRFPTDATMSRLHAELRPEGQSWRLVNLSRHGTLVARKRIEEDCALAPGDVVVLGDTRLIFELEAIDSAPVPGADAYTPATPTSATPPSAAGYDADGNFHMGLTLLGPAGGIETSYLWLAGGPSTAHGIRIKKRRFYFLLVVFILGLAGLLAMGVLIVWPAMREHPRILLMGAGFAFLPAIPYIFLNKLLDRNQQISWSNYLACLVWGGAVGCGFSLVINTVGNKALGYFFSPPVSFGLTATLVAPLVEECVKGLGVLVIFWFLYDEFDNVLEGMILGAASGLGFALVENVVYNVRFLEQGDVSTLLFMGTYRSVVNALIGHPVYTAMFGAGLGLLRETPRSRPIRYLYPIMGLWVAVGLHLTWNGAAVLLGSRLAGTNELLALLITTVVFGGAGLVFFMGAYWFAASRERRVLLTYLGEEVTKGFVEREELDSFKRLFGRERYELGGVLRGGWRVFRVRRALRRAQVDLALRKWHLAQGDAPRGHQVDAYVHAARTRIRDARNLITKLEGVQEERVVATIKRGELSSSDELALPTPSPMAEDSPFPPPSEGLAEEDTDRPRS